MGIIINIINRVRFFFRYVVAYFYVRLTCKKKMRCLFGGKSLAIVGSNPILIGQSLGSKIDQSEIVIRINLLQNDGIEKDLGSKTSYRFIGATMLFDHIEKLARIPSQHCIITTSKNQELLDSLNIRYVDFPSQVPKFAFRLINEICLLPKAVIASSKPPRSGIVILSLILRYGGAKSITLYGFSFKEQDAAIAISDEGEGIREYDSNKYVKNHCHPSLESYVLMKLLNEGYILSGDSS